MHGEGIGAGNGLEDGIGGLRPDEGFRIVVVGMDECGDGGLQFVHAAMDAALDPILAIGRPVRIPLPPPLRLPDSLLNEFLAQDTRELLSFDTDSIIKVKCRY